MCLLAVLFHHDPENPLLVGANRDERLDRPAIAATVLAEHGPRILGGRDLSAQGTWLAVNEHGVVAGLTNKPSPGGRDPSKRTRGELPLALATFATATDAVGSFVSSIRPADYNSAWLLVGDPESLWYLELGEGTAAAAEELEPGLHILGNGPLHSPSPKIDHVRQMIGDVTGLRAPEVLHRFRVALADHSIPPVPATTDGERPRQLAAACVHTESFGTRSAALVQVPAHGHPKMWVADGPPCTAPFRSLEGLWTEPAPSHQSRR